MTKQSNKKTNYQIKNNTICKNKFTDINQSHQLNDRLLTLEMDLSNLVGLNMTNPFLTLDSISTAQHKKNSRNQLEMTHQIASFTH